MTSFGIAIRDCRPKDIEHVLALWREAEAIPSITDNTDDLRRAVADNPAHVLVAAVDHRNVRRLARQHLPIGRSSRLSAAGNCPPVGGRGRKTACPGGGETDHGAGGEKPSLGHGFLGGGWVWSRQPDRAACAQPVNETLSR